MTGMRVLICERCGKQFERPVRRGPAPRCCSAACTHSLWRKRNPEKASAHGLRYRMVSREKHRALKQRWREANREKVREQQRRKRAAKREERNAALRQWRDEHPEATTAHRRVQTAVQNGTLTRGPCEDCGSTENVHAHHEDYGRPLDVQWLCASCHGTRHGLERRVPPMAESEWKKERMAA